MRLADCQTGLREIASLNSKMSDRKLIRVAAAQIAPVLDTPGATVEKVIETITSAAAQGARLIVFPETLVPYYPYFAFVQAPVATGAEHVRLYDNAVVVPGPVTEVVAAAAATHGIVVVLGVNERDHGTLYNTQLVFDANGDLALQRRKITPTFHERLIWGQGDGAGLTVVTTAVGRLGALACWEHYNPLARYALMAQHEEIHASQFPGSMVGQIFADQMEVTLRHHALESGCFVVNATGWLTEAQIATITTDQAMRKVLHGGCCTAIISPEGRHLAPPLVEGEGLLIADLDMSLIVKRKRMMDSAGHYARPELLRLQLNDAPARSLLRASAREAEITASPATAGRPLDAKPLPNGSLDREADQRVAILRGPTR